MFEYDAYNFFYLVYFDKRCLALQLKRRDIRGCNYFKIRNAHSMFARSCMLSFLYLCNSYIFYYTGNYNRLCYDGGK